MCVCTVVSMDDDAIKSLYICMILLNYTKPKPKRGKGEEIYKEKGDQKTSINI